MKVGDIRGMKGILKLFALRADTGLVRNVLKLFALSVAFVFSYSSFAESLLKCRGNSQQRYNEYKPVYEQDRGNVQKIYDMSVATICINRMQEGVELLETAADGGHVQANYFMAVYYEKDKNFDLSKFMTSDPENYNAMLFYYNRAADLIENNPQYPEDTYEDIPEFEKINHISARVFSLLPGLYFAGYNIAVGEILENAEEYTDTLAVLSKMRDSAERCLKRPALAVWKHKQAEIGHAMQVHCGAYWDFATKALPLEEKRLSTARQCAEPLNECGEHQKIINDLIDLVNIMWGKVDSVPSIG